MKNKILALFTTIDDKNLTYHVTQNHKNVTLAREKLAKKYKFDHSKLQFMEQIHSNIVKKVSSKTNIQTCDALITDKIDTPLMVMVADCIPMLFYDNKKKVIGVAHAGRNGTFKNIAQNTIYKMKESYNCDPVDIEVLLGPSIGKCCYEVSEDLALEATTLFGKEYIKGHNIDLKGINKKQLLDAGVLKSNITTEPICTKCSNQPYFSYRKDNKCGRFAGVIMMRSQQASP